jgi:hypothetical protein
MFINFENIGLSDSGKTQKWLASSTTGSVLGEVRWYAPWRRYVFYPRSETVFDAACLGELQAFCLSRTESHRGA